jgi:hypothetical protein
MTLAFNIAAGSFPCLPGQLLLLIPNPAKFGDRIGTGHFEACCLGSDQGHATVRWMNGEVDVLDGLPGYLN